MENIKMPDFKHICVRTSSITTAKKRLTKGRKRKSNLFKCGGCDAAFDTICTLHAHCSQHAEGGSYFYDNMTYTAFPKYVSACAFTQVSDELFDAEVRFNTGDDFVNQTRKTVSPEVVVKRETPVRQSKSQAKLNRIWVSSKRNQRKSLINKKAESISLSKNTNSPDAFEIVAQIMPQNIHNEPVHVDASKTLNYCKTEQILTKDETSTGKISEGLNTAKSENKSIKSTRRSKLKHCVVKKESSNNVEDAHERDELTASEVLIAISKGVSAEDRDVNQDCQGGNDNTLKPAAENIVDSVIRGEISKSECSTNHTDKVANFKEDGKSDEVILEVKQKEPKLKRPYNKKTTESKSIVQKCPICGKIGGKALMQYHKYIHMEKKNFTCETCGASFKHPKSLQMHQKQHGEKIFNCSVCSEGFYRKAYLRTHMLKHTGEEPYMCDYCGRSYREKNNLTRHIRHVHEKVRNYECNICNEKFFRSDHLKNHQLRHAEADKKCQYCPRLFKHPDDLHRHTKTHTGEKKWHCNICGHGFVSVSPYYVHMSKKHEMNREEAKVLKSQLQAEHKLRMQGLKSEQKPFLLTKDAACQSSINRNKPVIKQTTLDITTLSSVLPVASERNITDVLASITPISHCKGNSSEAENDQIGIGLDTDGIVESNNQTQHVDHYLLDFGNQDITENQIIVLGEIEIDEVAAPLETVMYVDSDEVAAPLETVMYVDSNQFAEEVIINN